MHLMATSLGVGAYWSSWHDLARNSNEMLEFLGLDHTKGDRCDQRVLLLLLLLCCCCCCCCPIIPVFGGSCKNPRELCGSQLKPLQRHSWRSQQIVERFSAGSPGAWGGGAC